MVYKLLLILNVLIFFTMSFVSLVYSGVKELCERGSMFDLFKDIRWEEVFPISIGPVRIKGPSKLGNPPQHEDIGKLLCVCKRGGKLTIGLVATYWQPVRAVETVKIPFCIPTFGKFIDLGNYWKLMGEHSDLRGMESTFTNAHMLKFNLLDLLNIFLDVPCVPHEGVDILYLTEIDPAWNDSVISQFMHPEAILFANPTASLACMADSVASTVGWPLDPLFWCAGGWGSVYPFTGHNESPEYLRGNVLNMARFIYRETRIGVSWDPGLNECGAVITPIWIKSHFKFHELKPVRGPALRIGHPTILWSHMKNPPGGTSKGSGDNFSWVIFKFVKCCLGFTR